MFQVLCLAALAVDAGTCGAPSATCIRGSPGTPGPGKATIKKFLPTDTASASLGACCSAAAAAAAVAGADIVAVQLVTKPGKPQECWLMGQPEASKTMDANCTSAQIVLPPTPVPLRPGPPQLPLSGSARGIVNLGGGPAAVANDPSFERFQQIDLQWADIEPVEGVYNWTLPDILARSINASGRMAVFKVNSNIKPAWLYDRVPWANITWTPEQQDGKTAMYWHPAYVEALSRRIKAEAAWLASSASGWSYTYMRQTWAAIGEEGLGIPTGKGAAVAALRDGKHWTVPSGCAPQSSCHPPPSYNAGDTHSGSALTSPTDVAYLEAIGKVWLDAFNRSSPSSSPRWPGVLLLRANAYETRWANITTHEMANGHFGWFHTGAGMEETQCFNQTFRYAPFRRDCLEEHGVVCFAESCGMDSFAGPDADKKITPALRAANFSRIQGAYWELLSNMASGMHVSGVHSSTFLNPFMFQPNFANVYGWADAYMGLHASPSLAPGGWIAFRPADGEGTSPPTLIGDYAYLMQRLAALESDTSVGEMKCGTSWEGGDGNFSSPWGAWCRLLPPGGVMSLILDPALAKIFAQREKGEAMVRLVHSVHAAGSSIEVRYDNGAPGGAIAVDTAMHESSLVKDASSWRDVRANVSGAAFARGGANGADVWVTNKGSDVATIHMVEVAHKR